MFSFSRIWRSLRNESNQPHLNVQDADLGEATPLLFTQNVHPEQLQNDVIIDVRPLTIFSPAEKDIYRKIKAAYRLKLKILQLAEATVHNDTKRQFSYL